MNNVTIKEIKEKDTVIEKQKQTIKLMTEKEIIDKAKKIDTEKVATEILNWLIENVESYIENTTRTYLIDLILDKTSKCVTNMEETKKLQSLYESLLNLTDSLSLTQNKITIHKDTHIDELNLNEKDQIDTDNADQLLASNILDDVVKDAHKKMKQQKELSEKLFKRMSYYYEFVGFSNGELLIKELIGGIDISKFAYDTFSVKVKVRDVVTNNITKEYEIPEGFSLQLNIEFEPETSQSCLF